MIFLAAQQSCSRNCYEIADANEGKVMPGTAGVIVFDPDAACPWPIVLLVLFKRCSNVERSSG